MQNFLMCFFVCMPLMQSFAQIEFDGEAIQAQLEKDLRKGDVHFLSTTGLGVQYPGVGYVTKLFCFNKIATKVVSKKGGEVQKGLSFDEEADVMEGILNYVSTYNVLLSRHLNANDQSECPNSERWDEALRSINDVFVKSKMGNSYDFQFDYKNGIEIDLVIYDLSKISAVKRLVCDAFEDNGINRVLPINLIVGPRSNAMTTEVIYCQSCID